MARILLTFPPTPPNKKKNKKTEIFAKGWMVWGAEGKLGRYLFEKLKA